MERRDFNKLALTIAADAALAGSLLGCVSKSVVPTPPATANQYGKRGRLLANTLGRGKGKGGIRVFDWDDHSYRDHAIPLELAHSIARDRTDADVIYVFEVFGSAVKLNLRTGDVVKIDHRDGRAMFNGHAATLPGGELIACTEIDNRKGSTVRLRSTKDLSIVEELPEACQSVHQVVALPDTSILAMGNAIGGKGAITFYDTKTSSVVRQVELPHTVLHLSSISASEVIGISVAAEFSSKMDALHAVKTESGAMSNLNAYRAVASHGNTQLAHVSLDGKNRFLLPENQRSLAHYTFAVAKSPCGRLVSSHVKANKVLIWKDFEIQGRIDVTQPRNIQVSADGSELMVLGAGSLSLFSMSDFGLIKKFDGWPYVAVTSSYV